MIHPANAYYTPRPRFAGERQDAPRTPAGRIVRQLGGPAETARLAGCSVKSVYRWLAPRLRRGGTGGRVPAMVQDRLIAAAAAQKGLVLDHGDFTPKPGEAFL